MARPYAWSVLPAGRTNLRSPQLGGEGPHPVQPLRGLGILDSDG